MFTAGDESQLRVHSVPQFDITCDATGEPSTCFPPHDARATGLECLFATTSSSPRCGRRAVGFVVRARHLLLTRKPGTACAGVAFAWS